MRRFRRVRKTRKALHDIPLTPMIDTALTLLIIFMVASPIMHNAIKVTLPHGSAQEANQSTRELMVFVDKTGAVFFDDAQVSVDELLDKLQSVVSGDDQIVFVNGDTGTSYGSVIELVDKLKVGGIRYVALATQKA